jgi:hypothetical protein
MNETTTVTVLFTDVVGSNRLGSDPAAKRRRYFKALNVKGGQRSLTKGTDERVTHPG